MLPKYVENILARSQWKLPWNLGISVRRLAAAGYNNQYSFVIQKETQYTTARVFRREVDRFVAWANREAKQTYGSLPVAHVLFAPEATHHRNQYAVVKITDPIMHDIENKIIKELS